MSQNFRKHEHLVDKRPHNVDEINTPVTHIYKHSNGETSHNEPEDDRINH